MLPLANKTNYMLTAERKGRVLAEKSTTGTFN
jgi:hypothetical protein